MILKKTKTGVLLLMSLFVTITFSGCGANSDSVQSVKDMPASEKPTNSQAVQPDTSAPTGNETISINYDYDGLNTELPEGYPSDIFPLYKDSAIASVMEYNGGYTVIAFAKDDFNTIAAFYKEVLKDAAIIVESNTAEGFTSFGKIGTYTYNFDTGASDEYEGYSALITIILIPEE
jgi:hypothetical protein